MYLKLLNGECYCYSVYDLQIGRGEEEKEAFWDFILSLVGDIPTSETVIIGGDLNGNVGASMDGYENVHGGYGFSIRHADGEKVLEFHDAM